MNDVSETGDKVLQEFDERIQQVLFLTNSQEVAEVVDYLMGHLQGEVYQKKVRSRPIAQWEQFIRIKR